MKRSCIFILAFLLTLSFHHGASIIPGKMMTFQQWYERVVKNCTPGFWYRSQKPQVMCFCLRPGAVSCRDEIAREDDDDDDDDDDGLVCKKQSGNWVAKDGCNRCFCYKGEPMCTVKWCEKRYRRGITALSSTFDGQPNLCKKQTGSWLADDGCNRCGCHFGAVHCTFMRCDHKYEYKKTAAEHAGSCKKLSGRWNAKDGCNWCFCDKGRSICTAMGCIKKKKKLVTDVENCKSKPLGRFKSEDACNWCYCIDSNTPICTQMLCYKTNTALHKNKMKESSNAICKAADRTPGRFLHEDGCNWCFCIGSRIVMCTIVYCPKAMPQRLKGLRKLTGRASNGLEGYVGGEDNAQLPRKQKLKSMALSGTSLKEMAQSCKAGSKFKDPSGCNWCNCIEDGVVVCDQEDCDDK